MKYLALLAIPLFFLVLVKLSGVRGGGEVLTGQVPPEPLLRPAQERVELDGGSARQPLVTNNSESLGPDPPSSGERSSDPESDGFVPPGVERGRAAPPPPSSDVSTWTPPYMSAVFDRVEDQGVRDLIREYAKVVEVCETLRGSGALAVDAKIHLRAMDAEYVWDELQYLVPEDDWSLSQYLSVYAQELVQEINSRALVWLLEQTP